MIEKTLSVDQISVLEDGTVSYRTATTIFENGQELTKMCHRDSLFPGQELTGINDKVRAICAVAWTPEVISNYQSMLEQRSNP